MMKLARRPFRAILFLAGCVLFAPAAQAQTQTAQAAAPDLQAKVPHPAAFRDVLRDDPRLDKKITTKAVAVSVDEALRTIGRDGGVNLASGSREISLSQLSFSYRGRPLRDVLASIAQVGNWEWTRRQDGVFLLSYRYDPGRLAIFQPHSEAEADEFRSGRGLLDRLAQAPALQQALTDPGNEMPDNLADLRPRGTTFGNLPTSMQDTVQQMLGDISRMYPDRPAPSADQLAGGRVFLSASVQEGVTFYTLNADYPDADGRGKTTSGMSFPVFDDPRDQGNDIIPPAALQNIHLSRHDAAQDAASRDAALATDPRLKAGVTLDLHDATLTDALRELSRQVPLDFVAQIKPGQDWLRASFSCRDMPLKDAIVPLLARFNVTFNGYPYASWWAHSKSGIFLFPVGLVERKVAPSASKPVGTTP